MKWEVILKNIKDPRQFIVLSEATTKENAEYYRRSWRKLLGGKNWTVERRPGLDTIDYLGLTVRKVDEEDKL